MRPCSKLVILSLIFMYLSGCAAVPPRTVTITELISNPDLYKNTVVQFEGVIKENKYFETRLGAWQLLITDGKNEFYCFKNGYNYSLLRRGVRLAEKAKEEEEAVTITGRLILPITTYTVPSLEIRKLSYKDESINVEMADYPYYYYYYYNPAYPRYRHFYHTPSRFRGRC